MYVAGASHVVVTSPKDDVTNATPEMRDFRHSGAVLLLVAHGVVFVLSVTGNAIVLYVIGRHLGYRTATNVYITTLCVADVATALVCLPLAAASVTLSRWSLGDEAACVAYDVVRRSLTLVSTSMTTALVVDRYMTVVRLRRVQTVIQRTVTTVAALVTFSVLASLPWYLIVAAASAWSSRTQHVDTAVMYNVAHTAATSGVPAVGLACCAGRVLRAVLRSTSAVRPSTSGAGQLLFQDELRTATTVILLVVVFVACRCVHCVLVGLAAWTTMTSGELAWRVDGRILLDAAAALAVTVNGAVNPAVYAVRNPNVARVLHLGRQQRYGGYVADDAASMSATHAAVTVPATHQADLGGELNGRLGAEPPDQPPVEGHTPRGEECESCDATNNSTKMTYVVFEPRMSHIANADSKTYSWSYGVSYGVMYARVLSQYEETARHGEHLSKDDLRRSVTILLSIIFQSHNDNGMASCAVVVVQCNASVEPQRLLR